MGDIVRGKPLRRRAESAIGLAALMANTLRPSHVSPDHYPRVGQELVGRHFQIARGWPPSHSTRCVIDRSVAGTVPTAEGAVRLIGSLAQGNASEVGADTDDDQPFRPLHPVFIPLGVEESWASIIGA